MAAVRTEAARRAPGLRPPGVHRAAPEPLGPGPLDAARMDVCAFVGVAPRGPAWERTDDPTLVDDAGLARVRSSAVTVHGWTEYEQVFGADEGPGLLAHAVAAYFAQGGRRAHVVRVVPSTPAPDPEPVACAVLGFTGTGEVNDLRLRARNEGSWGDRLRARLTFTATPTRDAVVDEGAELAFSPSVPLPPGTVLRLTPPRAEPVLRTVLSVRDRPHRADSGADRIAALDTPVAPSPAGPLRAEIVEGELELRDEDPRRTRTERFTGLGLVTRHPRWLGAVLAAESRLAELPDGITGARPGPDLTPAAAAVAVADRGRDRYAEIVPGDVLGVPGGPPAGLEALRELTDTASIVVCDLYAPGAPPSASDVRTPPDAAGATFAPRVPSSAPPAFTPPAGDLPGLRRDPSADLSEIIGLQRRVVGAAERLGAVALLDVPPGLAPHDVLAGRAAVDSSHAAGYHGWVRRAGVPVPVPPSAYAAGTIAASEITRGLATGPARLPLAGAVDVDTTHLTPTVLGELHRAGVDVLVLDRDGVIVTAARTLSRDRAWRQLTARRVVTALSRTISAQLRWAVFEPAGPVLRTTIRVLLEDLLAEFQRAGAFAGIDSASSFVVRVPHGGGVTDEGRVVAEIGVAPSEPVEFVLVRVVRGGDGGLGAEAGG